MKKFFILILIAVFSACTDDNVPDLNQSENEDMLSFIIAESSNINSELVPSISQSLKLGVKFQSYHVAVEGSLSVYFKNLEIFSSFPLLIDKISESHYSGLASARTTFLDDNYDAVELELIDKIAEAFVKLPNKDLFLSEIASINSEIISRIESPERQDLIKTISDNSKITALFWLSHKDELVADVNEAIFELSNGRIQGGWAWSWSDFGKEVAGGVAGGAVGGAIIGGFVSFGTLTVPGWVAGGIAGGAGGAAYYTIGQAWECAFG